jgi:hypothetical protein
MLSTGRVFVGKPVVGIRQDDSGVVVSTLDGDKFEVRDWRSSFATFLFRNSLSAAERIVAKRTVADVM